MGLMGLASVHLTKLALKAAAFCEITYNDGHRAVQGHSQSQILNGLTERQRERQTDRQNYNSNTSSVRLSTDLKFVFLRLGVIKMILH